MLESFGIKAVITASTHYGVRIYRLMINDVLVETSTNLVKLENMLAGLLAALDIW